MIDPMAQYPGYLLRRASALAMTRLTKRLKALDLTPSEAAVLTVIDANPNAKQSEIGRLLEIASANMAPLIFRLAARELIERQPVDGRSHGLALSATGRKVVVRIKAVFEEHESLLIRTISATRRATFVAALGDLMALSDK